MTVDQPRTALTNIDLVAKIWRDHLDCTWVVKNTEAGPIWSCGIIHRHTTRDRHMAALVMTQVEADRVLAAHTAPQTVDEGEEIVSGTCPDCGKTNEFPCPVTWPMALECGVCGHASSTETWTWVLPDPPQWVLDRLNAIPKPPADPDPDPGPVTVTDVLNRAADDLEGGLGVEGMPRNLHEFRQWLRARAALTDESGE